MLHDDVGTPDHFDVLAPVETTVDHETGKAESSAGGSQREVMLSLSAPDSRLAHTSAPTAAEPTRCHVHDTFPDEKANSPLCCLDEVRGSPNDVSVETEVARLLVDECISAACEECDDDCCWVPASMDQPVSSARDIPNADAGWRDWAMGIVRCGAVMVSSL